jgi:probable selenium-dependent hydroxylase accessory protein YqeC
MYPPPPELRWYDRYFPGGENALPPPETGENPVRGITLAGVINKKTGKLEALPQKTLEAAVSGYDLALLEGDGSRNLPLKGWADHEPVVPPCTAVTIGVIPVTPVGETVSRDIIFRLPRFLRLSGAQEGSPVTPGHLAAVITGKTGERGLFSAALGRKLLVINQVEDEARREQAREIVARLPEAFLAGLEGIVAGSVRQDRAEVLR